MHRGKFEIQGKVFLSKLALYQRKTINSILSTWISVFVCENFSLLHAKSICVCEGVNLISMALENI